MENPGRGLQKKDPPETGTGACARYAGAGLSVVLDVQMCNVQLAASTASGGRAIGSGRGLRAYLIASWEMSMGCRVGKSRAGRSVDNSFADEFGEDSLFLAALP